MWGGVRKMLMAFFFFFCGGEVLFLKKKKKRVHVPESPLPEAESVTAESRAGAAGVMC